MRTALIVALAMGWIASAAFAQTAPSAPSQPNGAAPAASSAATRDKGNLSPGKTAENQLGSSSSDGALADCLQMWDLATHMSRKEWARACRRVAERLNRPALR